MKYKLLKKIRKEYSIKQIDKLSSHPDKILQCFVNEFGYPIFIVEDSNDYYYLIDSCFKTLNEAMDEILRRVLKRYSRKFRYVKENSKKVWFNK